MYVGIAVLFVVPQPDQAAVIGAGSLGATAGHANIVQAVVVDILGHVIELEQVQKEGHHGHGEGMEC